MPCADSQPILPSCSLATAPKEEEPEKSPLLPSSSENHKGDTTTLMPPTPRYVALTKAGGLPFQ